MPAGCEFLCENQVCPNFTTSFNLTSAWSLGDIDKVIESKKNKMQNTNDPYIKDFLEGNIKFLEDLSKNGTKYALIDFPNVNNIETKGYRINRYCSTCKKIYLKDVLNDEINGDIELAESKVESICKECGAELLNFNSAIESNINCPACGNELKQKRWFAT